VLPVVLGNLPLSYESDSFDSTTPRAVLTWYPDSEWMVYGSYSEGFRSGSPQYPPVVRVVPGFGPAKPDKLHNYEIGAKADLLGKRISIETALYYIEWNDVMQNIQVPFGNNVLLTALINGESASGLGFDFGMTARPLDGLELGVNFCWNDLKHDADTFSGGTILFRKGSRLASSSEFAGAVSGDYSFPLGGKGFKGRLSASANYISEQQANTLNGPIFGDSLMTARAGLALVAPDHWTATIFVDNISNEYGVLAAQGQGAEFSPRMRPRTVGLQIDYRF
jgi:iron complex outermembrane recepter protein